MITKRTRLLDGRSELPLNNRAAISPNPFSTADSLTECGSRFSTPRTKKILRVGVPVEFTPCGIRCYASKLSISLHGFAGTFIRTTSSARLIEQRIFLIRGHKVMVDSDLASLYDVATGALNRAVKRNIDRFPEDFCFQLTEEELEALRFQFGISNKGRGGRRYLLTYSRSRASQCWRAS